MTTASAAIVIRISAARSLVTLRCLDGLRRVNEPLSSDSPRSAVRRAGVG